MKIQNISAFFLAIVLSFSIVNCMALSDVNDGCVQTILELSVEEINEKNCSDDPSVLASLKAQSSQEKVFNFVFENEYTESQLKNPPIKPPIFLS